MAPAHEILKKQFEKFLIVICDVLELCIDGNRKTAVQIFDSYKAFHKPPEDLKLTSRFDEIKRDLDKVKWKLIEELYGKGVDPEDSKSRIEMLENDLLNTAIYRIEPLEHKINNYINRSWWRRFFGIGPQKENIDSHTRKSRIL